MIAQPLPSTSVSPEPMKNTSIAMKSIIAARMRATQNIAFGRHWTKNNQINDRPKLIPSPTRR